MKDLPSNKISSKTVCLRMAVMAFSAVAISGCTSTIANLDTSVLQLEGQESNSNAQIAVSPSSPFSVTRPPSTLSGDEVAASQTDTALASLNADETASAGQVTSEAIIQPSGQSETPADFPQPPASVAPEPSTTAQIADQRIAQANAAPTATTENQNYQSVPVVSVATTTPDAPRSGLLDRLFSRKPPTPQEPVAVAQAVAATTTTSQTAAAAPPPAIAVNSAGNPGLPGVDRERLFGINQSDKPSDTRPIQVASAAGLARLAPNGLRTQHSGVDVACLKPSLVRVLKRVEREFGKPVVITSGYRSPSRNSNARGAKNSLHIYCAAADIQIEGVSKWDLASYLRSMPGRGGVGTYCHTKSVHIDIGPKRDWNWRCRRG
ncbi:MAG: D-Ala-D-Ala carboxypeptidase family metallohydrolase [Pseudomonadota bacterium]